MATDDGIFITLPDDTEIELDGEEAAQFYEAVVPILTEILQARVNRVKKAN